VGGKIMREQSIGAIFNQKAMLIGKLEELSDFCGMPKRRLQNTLLLKTVSNIACEKKIMCIVNNRQLVAESKFDSYYRQKSVFATTRILDHVQAALYANNLAATINTEVSTDCGRYDAIISLNKLDETDSSDACRVRIEIKASLGLDLEQIGR
jgi:hypothetical protein